jgi:flagellin-like hook-associated protein FlgL
LNHGLGVTDRAGTDFTIRRKDGATIAVNLAGAQTVGDVLALINTHPANVAPPVTARLAQFGNGIELVTSDPAVVATFAVLADTGAAQELGLVPEGASISAPAVVSGGTEVITGRDVNPQETEGALGALVRLRDALRNGSVTDVQRAVEMLDRGSEQINVARAELGARQQALEVLQNRLQDEEVELRGALSQEIDVDLAQVISDLTARQTALQASLQLIGQLSQLTLLDYL